MIVKICGITNREDALAAVDAGASAIGFNFYRESPRYISHTGAAMIAEKIPANVWKVGVFVNESPETIAKTVIEAGLDVAQLHGSSDARGVRIWRAMSPLDPVALAMFGDVAVSYTHLDVYKRQIHECALGLSQHHFLGIGHQPDAGDFWIFEQLRDAVQPPEQILDVGEVAVGGQLDWR